ncbi:MAG: transcriptional repressor [Elusimicrobia bacterium]|nr:transcriptional repressor [Elusimicrobiota bacterium]
MKRSALSSAAIEERLKQAGLQPTAQRIAILRCVLCEAEHPTADDVKRWMDENFPKVSLATVYNTLGALVRVGVLKEIQLPHSGRTVYDDNVAHHYHFIDERTGKVFDVDPGDVELKPKLGKGFQVRSVEVYLRGEKA